MLLWKLLYNGQKCYCTKMLLCRNVIVQKCFCPKILLCKNAVVQKWYCAKMLLYSVQKCHCAKMLLYRNDIVHKCFCAKMFICLCTKMLSRKNTIDSENCYSMGKNVIVQKWYCAEMLLYKNACKTDVATSYIVGNALAKYQTSVWRSGSVFSCFTSTQTGERKVLHYLSYIRGLCGLDVRVWSPLGLKLGMDFYIFICNCLQSLTFLS